MQDQAGNHSIKAGSKNNGLIDYSQEEISQKQGVWGWGQGRVKAEELADSKKTNREVTGKGEGIRKKSNWRYLFLSRFPGKYPYPEIYFVSTPTPTYIPK